MSSVEEGDATPDDGAESDAEQKDEKYEATNHFSGTQLAGVQDLLRGTRFWVLWNRCTADNLGHFFIDRRRI